MERRRFPQPQMSETPKDLLTKCQIYLEDGNYDLLISTLEKLTSANLENMTKEECEEAIKIVDFLIERAEKKRLRIAEKLINFRKFKDYLK